MAHLVYKLAKAPPRLSRRPYSIVLYAAMVYAFNALNSRPAEGRAESDLLSVCLPRREADPEEMGNESDDDETQFITFNPYGIFFLRDLVLNPCPRLPQDRQLKAYSYPPLLGGERQDLLSTFQNALFEKRSRQRVPDHISNKRPYTIVFHPTEEEEELMAELKAMIEQIQLPENVAYDFDDGVEGDERDLADTIVKIFMQFRSDLLQKSPLTKLKRNYLKMEVDRLHPAAEVFTDKKLSRYWISIQFKASYNVEWKDTIKKLFPTEPGAVKIWSQNFQQCSYLIQWGNLVTQFLGANEKWILKRMKLAIEKLLDTMLWLPVGSDRLWDTRARATYVRKGDPSIAAPAILLNPRTKENQIRWEESRSDDRWRELRQEDEESSD